MKKIIIALTAIAAMASCKKENVTTVPDPVTKTVKTLAKISSAYDNGTPQDMVYTYDALGRISTIKEDYATETFDYASATSLIVSERVNNNGNLLATRECTLNSNGYVTKIVVKNTAGNINGTYDYSYNADGNVTSRLLTYPGGSTMKSEFSITDGNMVAVKAYSNNVLTATNALTFDATKLNKSGFGYVSYWNVPNLFGKGSKNLAVESKSFDAYGALTYHMQYAYELDAAGYTVKQINKYVMQGKQGVDSFIYQ